MLSELRDRSSRPMVASVSLCQHSGISRAFERVPGQPQSGVGNKTTFLHRDWRHAPEAACHPPASSWPDRSITNTSLCPGTVRSGSTSTRPARSTGAPRVRPSGDPNSAAQYTEAGITQSRRAPRQGEPRLPLCADFDAEMFQLRFDGRCGVQVRRIGAQNVRAGFTSRMWVFVGSISAKIMPASDCARSLPAFLPALPRLGRPNNHYVDDDRCTAASRSASS